MEWATWLPLVPLTMPCQFLTEQLRYNIFILGLYNVCIYLHRHLRAAKWFPIKKWSCPCVNTCTVDLHTCTTRGGSKWQHDNKAIVAYYVRFAVYIMTTRWPTVDTTGRAASAEIYLGISVAISGKRYRGWNAFLLCSNPILTVTELSTFDGTTFNTRVAHRFSYRPW